MKNQTFARPLSAWLALALAAALLTVCLAAGAWLWPALGGVPGGVPGGGARVAQGPGGAVPAAWGAATLATGLLGLLALGMVLRRARDLQHLRQRRQQDTQLETGRLEALVQQRTAQLVELAQHLQTAREDERHRLARDLHDELGALLTAAKLDTARIQSRLVGVAGAPADTLERLDHLSRMLDQVIAAKRRIAEDLRPSALAHLGLVPTLDILAREFGRNAGVTVHSALRPVPLSPAAELTAYRVVQEALTNVSKHAQARQVWLSLRTQDGQAVLGVRDDGRGFDSRAACRSAYGLVGMRYRVQAERGSLWVDSAPGRGTTIGVTLPLQAQGMGVVQRAAEGAHG